MSEPVRKRIINLLVQKLEALTENIAVFMEEGTFSNDVGFDGTYSDARRHRRMEVEVTGADEITVTETTLPDPGETIPDPFTIDTTGNVVGTRYALAYGVEYYKQVDTMEIGAKWDVRAGHQTFDVASVLPYYTSMDDAKYPSVIVLPFATERESMPLERYEHETRFIIEVRTETVSRQMMYMEEYLADIMDELSADINMFDGTDCLATNSWLGRDHNASAEVTSEVFAAQIEFYVQYRTAFDDMRRLV